MDLTKIGNITSNLEEQKYFEAFFSPELETIDVI
jgi:hypothetical protein